MMIGVSYQWRRLWRLINPAQITWQARVILTLMLLAKVFDLLAQQSP